MSEPIEDRPARRNRDEGLTPERFEALLRFLDADRDRAALYYEDFRRRLIRLFEWRRLDRPEDLADVTIDRVARKIEEGTKVESDHYRYFCGVAYLLIKETLRHAARERTALEKEGPGVSLVDGPPEEEDDRLVCLRRCLDRLPEDQRHLVLRYHQEADHIRSRQTLSQELGIPMNALRIRVHRIRRKLEDCVLACLRKSSGRDRR